MKYRCEICEWEDDEIVHIPYLEMGHPSNCYACPDCGNIIKVCKCKDCEEEIYSKGYCEKHYDNHMQGKTDKYGELVLDEDGNVIY